MRDDLQSDLSGLTRDYKCTPHTQQFTAQQKQSHELNKSVDYMKKSATHV